MKDIATKSQGIRISGVGTHLHKGGAESSTKIVVYKTFYMVIHAALCWPEVSETYLLPLALNYATYLHDITLSQDTGI